MYFGFTIDSSDIYLWDINLLDTDLDLLYTDIPSKHFACLQDIFKTFWKYSFKMSLRHVFKTSSRHVLKALEDVFSITIFHLPRHLQNVFKTSSRRLGRRKIVTLMKMYWRRLQDMSWRPISVCWVLRWPLDFSIILKLMSCSNESGQLYPWLGIWKTGIFVKYSLKFLPIWSSREIFFRIKVVSSVQIWKKTFCQNSDYFGYFFIKIIIMYLLCIYKKTIILSLFQTITLYILTILTCLLKTYIVRLHNLTSMNILFTIDHKRS